MPEGLDASTFTSLATGDHYGEVLVRLFCPQGGNGGAAATTPGGGDEVGATTAHGKWASPELDTKVLDLVAEVFLGLGGPNLVDHVAEALRQKGIFRLDFFGAFEPRQDLPNVWLAPKEYLKQTALERAGRVQD